MTPEMEEIEKALERRKARLLQAAATIYVRRYVDVKEAVLTALAIEALLEKEIV